MRCFEIGSVWPHSEIASCEAVDLKSGLANVRYNGTLQLGDAPSVDGNFEAAVPNAAALARQFDLDLPARTALGRVQVSGKASGALDADACVADERRKGRVVKRK